MVDECKQEEVALDNRIGVTNGEGDIIYQCTLQHDSTTPESEPPDSKEGVNGINQPPDEWLPITRSQKGNSWTATFHLLCSGIGIQTLSLPIALVYLGWFWGSLCLCVAFVWQLYTIGLLVNLHECVPGTRYSRYIQLSVAAFGYNAIVSRQSSSKIMWKGVVASYLIIAMCFFPVASVGYWALGNKILTNGGLLTALSNSIHHHTSKPILGLIYAQLVISSVTAFQIFGMVVYDNLERAYASRTSKRRPTSTRTGIKIFFGALTFFISVAFPFLPSLSLIVGGVALPLTYGYPCLMWIAVKRPPMKSTMWCFNLGLGLLGIGLSVSLVVGAVWNLACTGLDANFFHPH